MLSYIYNIRNNNNNNNNIKPHFMFISSYPHILISSYPHILISSHPGYIQLGSARDEIAVSESICEWSACALLYVSQKRARAEVPPTRSSRIVMSPQCAHYPHIPTSSYPYISLYPHILISSNSYITNCINIMLYQPLSSATAVTTTSQTVSILCYQRNDSCDSRSQLRAS